MDELTGMFKKLEIEGNNKDRQIENQSKDIGNLKAELNKTKEGSLELELKEQERKLNEFIQKLGIGREKPRELQKAYRQLIRAREDYDQNNIDEADDKIENIKGELLQKGVSRENVQKLCQKCGKIANLKEEQDKMYKWRFEARQEVLTNS